MTEYYFSQQPQSHSSPKTWQYLLRNKTYTFTSDIGVFSKNDIDFGSRLLIEEFVEPMISGDFLDLGCGYGPIGVALAGSYPKRKVTMVDVNQRALDLAIKNVEQNNIHNTELILSDRLHSLKGHKFASIITNPPIRAGKDVVHAMIEDSAQALHEGGELWIVIQKKQGAPSALNKMEETFGNAKVLTKDKGYWIIKSEKE